LFDWQGKNADRHRETQVRLLWNTEFLFLQFDARYRSINIFADAELTGRRDGLWIEMYARCFCSRADRTRIITRKLKWRRMDVVDLEIAPKEKHDLRSGLRRRVDIDESQKQWRAVLAIPMKKLVARFEMPAVWRVNFFRVEGMEEPRFYSAWRPTNTPAPNFHVPEAFGALVFTEAGGKIGG